MVLRGVFFFPGVFLAFAMAFKTLCFPGETGMAVVGRHWYYRFKGKKIQNERDN